jgi:hypothetical protein
MLDRKICFFLILRQQSPEIPQGFVDDNKLLTVTHINFIRFKVIKVPIN